MSVCTLCELPAEGVTADDVDGTFCCRGCLEVYRSLGDIDVTQHREAVADEPRYPDSAETAYLAVDGMHCSTCELFLERNATTHEGLYGAEASYAAETIKLVYDPERWRADELADVVSGLGYRARGREEEPTHDEGAVSRLLVGGIFAMMAMTWYALFLYPTYFGYDPVVEFGAFDGLYLYAQLAVVTAIILLYTGQPMLRGAYVSLRAGQPNVDLLVTVAALAAYLYSTGRLLVGGTDLYYDVTIVVVLAVTVGNFYEGRIKRRTAGLLADLTELQLETAKRADDETVPVEAIEAGDLLRVDPGERVPVDGIVREGRAAVDEALVTGESLPESKGPGDEVRGGTVVTDAPLLVEAHGNESTLDRVVELLWEIQASRPGAQRVADRLATVFVPLVLVLAAAVSVWLLATGSPPRVAVLAGLTVLIVSCPCALGLATPLAVASGLQSAAERGVVVATPALFEHTDEIDTVVLDKTGTITDGEMAVRTVEASSDADTLLARAGAVERHADHPIGVAIAETARERGLLESAASAETLETFEKAARGVSGAVDGDEVLVGHPELFHDREWELPDGIDASSDDHRQRGDVPVVVGWNGTARGVIGVGDSPRDGWEELVEELGRDARIVVLTGDDGPAAERLREHPSVDQVFAGVPPDGKAATVRRLAATETVAMVGDGSNDAPALAAADVGIALESGTQLASDAADAVVLGGEIERVPAVFDVARRTNRRIRENLVWAFLYNAVAIPLALTGLLNPLFAAVAMATSSLVVVANSARESGETPTPSERAERDNIGGVVPERESASPTSTG